MNAAGAVNRLPLPGRKIVTLGGVAEAARGTQANGAVRTITKKMLRLTELLMSTELSDSSFVIGITLTELWSRRMCV